MRYLTFLLIFIAAQLTAQTDLGLITSISFNQVNCPIVDDSGDVGISTLPSGNLGCVCGANGNGLQFDGDDDWFLVTGSKIEESFGAIDFTLSFYFKPLSGNSAENQVLFSKKNDCETDSSFSIKYRPVTRQLSVEMVENPSTSGSISTNLPINFCWYHITVVRQEGTTILYVNGEEVGRVKSFDEQRVNISNNAFFTVGHSECNLDEADFEGIIDEIRLYNRSLSRNEVEDLYVAPDMIANGFNTAGIKDTTIYLGNSIQIQLNPTCIQQFLWSPTDGVSDETAAEPLITPTDTTIYVVTMDDGLQCIINDSLRIIVVDPTTVSCSDILLPSAFTPNNDGLNDVFGISNPFVTGELLAFEIFDRWGNIVFATLDPLEKWDGSFRGTPVNPGVFLYKIHFRCEGKEDVRSGTVTVIR